ncbi:MAG: cation diffusion facilitator family transporter [Bacilli bacterium]|nr:cation diffusion facilitator family transporter [Bacilli bacterium]
MGEELVSSQINMSKELKVMLISLITNIGLSLVKIIAGLLGTSSALIVDGIHSFSDLITDFIAIIGNYLAKKPADIKHPYGHGISEYITSFIIGLMVIVVGLSVVETMSTKSSQIPSLFVIVIVITTIIIKMLLSRYLIHQGKNLNNSIIFASGKESGADVVTSIIVLISTLLSQLSNYFAFFKYIDKITSIIVALFIIKVGFNIARDSASHIMGEQEDNVIYLEDLKSEMSHSLVIINQFVLLKYGPYSKLLAEIALDGDISLKEAHEVIDEIETKIKRFDDKILYINIHMCPIVDKDK